MTLNWFMITDAPGEEALDTVRMRDALAHQHLAFAAEPAVVFRVSGP